MTEEASRKRLAQKRSIREYKNALGKSFRPGDRVKLNKRTAFVVKDFESETFIGRPVTSSTIASLLPDVRGWVLLENRLGGFWTWNVNDLQHTNRR